MAYQEVGWQPQQQHVRAVASPWLAHLPAEFELFEWHGDTFELPPGAQHLWANNWCQNQAFAWGDKVLAVQAHPEMTQHLVDLWLTEAGHLLDASQPSQQSSAFIRENLPARIAALNQVAAGFYRHWLHLAFA
jgi:GMP synthase (glutamine-hydrolysing)